MALTSNMNYEVARTLIKNGDLVNIYIKPLSFSLQSVVHSAIKFFTKSEIYHCVTATWMTSPGGIQRLMCSETNMKGGKRIVPLDLYQDEHLEVIPLPATADFSKMEEYLFERVGFQQYSFWSLLMIGVREFLGLPRMNLRGQVCSELCADAWRLAGVAIPDDQVSPGKLRAMLVAAGNEPTMHIGFE